MSEEKGLIPSAWSLSSSLLFRVLMRVNRQDAVGLNRAISARKALCNANTITIDNGGVHDRRIIPQVLSRATFGPKEQNIRGELLTMQLQPFQSLRLR